MYSFYRVFSQFDFSKLLRASCHALFEKEKEVHIVNTHIQLSKTFAQYCMGFGAYLIYSFCRQFCMDLCLPVSSFCCHVYLIAWLPFVLSRGKKNTSQKLIELMQAPQLKGQERRWSVHIPPKNWQFCVISVGYVLHYTGHHLASLPLVCNMCSLTKQHVLSDVLM